MNKKLIAVYGSLRKGLHNHSYHLGNAEYLGEFKTEPVYSLYSLSSFPGLKENGNTSVTMEVYAVTPEEEKSVDGLEGYTPGETATFYDKKPISTPFGEASVYTFVRDISDRPLVKDGDWKNYVKTQYSY